MNTHFIIQTASAKMPSSCWGRYGRIAVIECAASMDSVSQISKRARGVVRIIETWEKLNVGGPKSAYGRAMADAEALKSKLEQRRIRQRFGS